MSDQPTPRDVIRMVEDATTSAGRAASAIAGAILVAHHTAPEVANRLGDALARSGHENAVAVAADPAHIDALRVKFGRDAGLTAPSPAL